MTTPTAVLNDAAAKTTEIAEKGAAPVKSLAGWVTDNLDGLMTGSLVAIGLVVSSVSTFIAINRYLRMSLDDLY